MNQIIAFLNGRKTYIGIAAGALYSVLIHYHKLNDNTMVWTAIATWTGVSARLAISKVGK